MVGNPMRVASPVSGGAKSVASRAPLERAIRRLAAGPEVSKVTDCRGIFHSLSASTIEASCAPPRGDDTDFLADQICGLGDILLRHEAERKLVERSRNQHQIGSLIDGGDQGSSVDLSKLGASTQ